MDNGESPRGGRELVQRVALGCDHRGFEGKQVIKLYLQTLGYRISDVGVQAGESADYPDIAAQVARKVASGECERGIVVDMAGIASAAACNKVKGIRAAACHDARTVILSREHLNANVLALGGPLHSGDQLCELARLWLETRFAGGRHWPRVNKLMAIERGGI
jgi:ribose 5-phosphate isomerase B